MPRVCACSRCRDNEQPVFSLAAMAAVKITTRHDIHRERLPWKEDLSSSQDRRKFHKLILGTRERKKEKDIAIGVRSCGMDECNFILMRNLSLSFNRVPKYEIVPFSVTITNFEIN